MSSLLNDGFGRLLFYREFHLFSIYLELIFPTILADWRAERRLLRDEAVPRWREEIALSLDS